MAKRIGILTSGGDCAGLNAVIGGAVKRAAAGYGWEVVGIHEGTAGFLSRPVDHEVLDPRRFTGATIRQGGTLLGTTNRGDPFAYPMPDGSLKDRSEEIIEGYRSLGLDALIGVGGDGSLAILRRLAQQGGFPLVAVPKTIDNDLGATEFSIGYATAVEVAVQALDMLQPTAASHSRVMVLEVMGRDAGHLALAAGIAGGADVVLIPEIPYRIEAVAAKIEAIRATGRNHALVVVAEAVKRANGDSSLRTDPAGAARYTGAGQDVAQQIGAAVGAETRVTVLGHVTRGATPSAQDRLMGQVFGAHAVDLIAAEKFDRMVAWRNRAVVDVPIADAIRIYRGVDPAGVLVAAARGLSICLGDR